MNLIVNISELSDNSFLIPGILSFAILCCIGLLYLCRWRDYLVPVRLQKIQGQRTVSESVPNISVVVPSHNQAHELREYLENIFLQDYQGFEVIVVDEASTDGTRDLLETLQLKYKNLRYTFVPASASDISVRKLSVTLGVRAARTDWVLITNMTSRPASSSWLWCMASQCTSDNDAVIGYANYEDNGTSYSRKCIYNRMLVQLRCYRSALGYGAVGGDEANFCIRKSTFLSLNGYEGHLNVNFGEGHLLVDRFGSSCNVGVSLLPDAFVRSDLPPVTVWKNMRICYRQILKLSSKRARFYLYRDGFSTCIMYLFWMLLLAYMFLRVNSSLLWITDGDIDFVMLGIDTAVLLSLIFAVVCPIYLFNRMCRAFGERRIGFYHFWISIISPFERLLLKMKRYRLRYHFETNRI